MDDSSSRPSAAPAGFASSFLHREEANSSKPLPPPLHSSSPSSSSPSQRIPVTSPPSTIRRKPLPASASTSTSPVARSRPTSKLGFISAAAVRTPSGLTSPPLVVSPADSTPTSQRPPREDSLPFTVRDLDKYD